MGNALSTSASVGVLAIVAGLGLSWLATYLFGGAEHVVPHFYYIPIMLAAVRFGHVAVVVVAVVSGILAGPLTYVDVALLIDQDFSRWATRMAFFVAIGLMMSALVRPALPSFFKDRHRRGAARALREAIRRGELFVRYQPIISMRDGRVRGYEALVRWHHPVDGEIGPGGFLDLAESSGAILDVDAFVFEAACHQGAAWAELADELGVEPPWISVNMAAPNLDAPDLFDRIRDTLSRTGIEPQHVHIELTESMLVADFDLSVARLAGLKTLGLRIAIDDFGTGYSSLSAMRRFPADVLKIDREFISTMHADAASASVIGGIAKLATSLGVQTITEGIEVVEQRDTLVGHGYDLAQGFLYDRPLLAEDIDRMLRNGHRYEPARQVVED